MNRIAGVRGRLIQALRPVGVVAAAVFLGGAGTIHFDELKCEAAMAHLASCCPSFDPAGRNCYAGVQGEYYDQAPDLNAAESDCITALDCDAINQRDLCATVAKLPPSTFSYCMVSYGCSDPCPDADSVFKLHPPVCP